MYNNNPFSKKIKKLFFDHSGRISRKTFLIAFLALSLSIPVAYSTLYRLCGLFFPPLITNLLTLTYVGILLYSFCVIYIKRLHDLNKSGWWALITLIAPIGLPFFIYLAVARGKFSQEDQSEDLKASKDNEISEIRDPYERLIKEAEINNEVDFPEKQDSEMKQTTQLLSTKNGLIALAILAVFFLVSKCKDKYRITNDPKGVENMQKILNILPESTRKEVLKNKRSMGGVFIDDQFITVGVPITKDRILIRGVQFNSILQTSLSQNKKAEILFLDNNSANITKFITSNNALSVQMAVFQIDKTIGTPGHLNEKNRNLLQQMNAF